MDIVKHNQKAWDRYVEIKDRWTVPVSDQDVEKARLGQGKLVLTPHKTVPEAWFPELKGLKILGLASGGGQQGPILAALGARVTIFDNSEQQLKQDKTVSDKHDLGIETVQGDMKDLSVFKDASFDLIFNPCSVVFVENVLPVWAECYRVLKPGGVLMSGLMNPMAFQLDEKSLKLIYKQPFSDLHSLPKKKLEQLKADNEALVFGHSLTDQIGGQLKAGFRLSEIYEDDWGGDNKMDAFFPAFIATRAIKPV